jgi:hypothetical protein
LSIEGFSCQSEVLVVNRRSKLSIEGIICQSKVLVVNRRS